MAITTIEEEDIERCQIYRVQRYRELGREDNRYDRRGQGDTIHYTD